MQYYNSVVYYLITCFTFKKSKIFEIQHAKKLIILCVGKMGQNARKIGKWEEH